MATLLETRLRNRYRVQPNHANNVGTLHGGNLMKWLDEVGAMSAMRFAGETCVTAGVNELGFHRPIRVGDVALIESYVYEAGRTSARVAVRGWREDPRTGETERTTESTFTFVAIDDDGTPTGVGDLAVDSAEGERLRSLAREIEA